jgi:hypothetical protein
MLLNEDGRKHKYLAAPTVIIEKNQRSDVEIGLLSRAAGVLAS